MVPQSRPDVLNLRPVPQAARFHAQLCARYGKDLVVHDSPLMAARYFHPELPQIEGGFGAVIFTSETGVLAAAPLRARLPDLAFCVGMRTAEVAQSLGFDTIEAEGDAVSLLALLQRHPQAGPFLHLHGRDVTGDITGDLIRLGIPARGVVVYAQEEQDLAAAARARLARQGRLLVPLMSPRAGRLFRARLAEQPVAAELVVLALSPAVQNAFGPYDGAKFAVAKSPSQAELLAQMDRFLS